jgi:hypothetical protein
MNRHRFNHILYNNPEPLNQKNVANIVFAIKPIYLKKNADLEEKDNVDFFYDVSYNSFHLYHLQNLELEYGSKEKDEKEKKEEEMDLSDIYIGDYLEKDIHFINPLLSNE